MRHGCLSASGAVEQGKQPPTRQNEPWRCQVCYRQLNVTRHVVRSTARLARRFHSTPHHSTEHKSIVTPQQISPLPHCLCMARDSKSALSPSQSDSWLLTLGGSLVASKDEEPPPISFPSADVYWLQSPLRSHDRKPAHSQRRFKRHDACQNGCS